MSERTASTSPAAFHREVSLVGALALETAVVGAVAAVY
jgi:hypothetical protein